MLNYFLGLVSGLFIATIIVVVLYSFRKEITHAETAVKKTINGKGAFIEPGELTDKINRFFTK